MNFIAWIICNYILEMCPLSFVVTSLLLMQFSGLDVYWPAWAAWHPVSWLVDIEVSILYYWFCFKFLCYDPCVLTNINWLSIDQSHVSWAIAFIVLPQCHHCLSIIPETCLKPKSFMHGKFCWRQLSNNIWPRFRLMGWVTQ